MRCPAQEPLTARDLQHCLTPLAARCVLQVTCSQSWTSAVAAGCKKGKRFEIKKWNAVSHWALEIMVDNCAICRNHIMDHSVQASSARRIRPEPPAGCVPSVDLRRRKSGKTTLPL